MFVIKQKQSNTVVQEILACKIFHLFIFHVVWFSSHEPSEKFSTVKNIRRKKYFACLIFVGKAHGRKLFNDENFPNHGNLLKGSVQIMKSIDENIINIQAQLRGLSFSGYQIQ